MMQKITFSEKFRLFDEVWSPRIVGEMNGFHVKLVKLDGEFVWHHHDVEDELFLVIAGRLRMLYRDEAGEREIVFGPGECLIVPHGTEHKPVADPGTQILLIEPQGTVNTGTAEADARTTTGAWI